MNPKNDSHQRVVRPFAHRLENGKSLNVARRSASWIHNAEHRATLSCMLSVWITLFATPVFAQSKPIEIEVAGMQPTIQMGRPITSWWDVNIKGTGLIEGRLEFTLFNDTQLLTTTTTEELALTGPQQRIRVMLPPVDDDVVPIDQLRVEVRFRGKKLTQNLGSHILRVAQSRVRTFMVLGPATRLTTKTAERERMLRRLAFESLAFVDLEEVAKTIVASLEPNELPQEPMAYCAYEVVVLFSDEFRQLKKATLDALVAWYRAGGSLYVEPTGVLESYHLEFLQKLAASDSRGLVFHPDSHGRLVPGTIWEDERILMVTNSLGRAVIRVEEEAIRVEDNQPDPFLQAAQWRQAVAFLWRLHSDQVQTLGTEESGRLLPLLPNGWYPNFDGNGGFQEVFTGQQFQQGPGIGRPRIQGPQQRQTSMPYGWLSWKLRTSTGELVDRLMPDGVKMVPLWVLGLILVSFVVWIGPVDYFLLGRFKARKYTWLTFPLATILVTAFTVWITNQYMSSAETRRALIVQDVGDDGAIVRTNRFELLFVASSRPATTDIRKGVFNPLETGVSVTSDAFQMAQMAQINYQRAQMNYQLAQMYRQRGVAFANRRGNPGPDRTPTRLEGRIPTEFTAMQNMSKWTPQLNRLFSISGAKDEAVIDWNGLTAGIPLQQLLASHSIPNELTARVRTQFGLNASVACLGSNGRWAYDHGGVWSSNQMQSHMQAVYDNWETANARLPIEVQQQAAMFRWMYQHSVAIPYGAFGLLTSIGPTGAANLNDLPILDPSDTSQVLLIVVVPRGDDFVAYRKLMRFTEPEKNPQ